MTVVRRGVFGCDSLRAALVLGAGAGIGLEWLGNRSAACEASGSVTCT
jgi:hypothetical protein